MLQKKKKEKKEKKKKQKKKKRKKKIFKSWIKCNKAIMGKIVLTLMIITY